MLVAPTATMLHVLWTGWACVQAMLIMHTITSMAVHAAKHGTAQS